MPLMLDPASARISNSNCSVTSPFGWMVGVALTLTPEIFILRAGIGLLR